MPISSLAQSEPPQAKRTTSIVGIPDNRVPTSASIPAIVIGPRGLERDGLVGILNQNGYAILDSVEAVSDIRPGSLPALIILSEFGQEQIEAGLIPVVQSRFPAARIVALTDEADPSVPRYLLQMGTQACLNRSTQPIALIRSLNVVMGGNIVISTDAASHLTGGTGGNQTPPADDLHHACREFAGHPVGSLPPRDRGSDLSVRRALEQVHRPGTADLRGDREDPRQERPAEDQRQQPHPGGGLGLETRCPEGRLPAQRQGGLTRSGRDRTICMHDCLSPSGRPNASVALFAPEAAIRSKGMTGRFWIRTRSSRPRLSCSRENSSRVE